MATTKKTVTKKELGLKIKKLEYLLKEKDERVADFDRMLSISRDNERHYQDMYQTEGLAHQQTKRRAKSASNLLKGTEPHTADVRMKIAVGLLENKPLVDVADEVANDVDPMAEVVMVACGMRKIEVIKALRNEFGLGLKDSKELTDRIPVTVAKVPTSEAGEMIKRLEKSGAMFNARVV